MNYTLGKVAKELGT